MESKILDKIKKLVKKQQSAEELGSVKEAEIFAAKVQELLNKHNLSMSQLSKDKIQEEVTDNILKRKIPSIGGNSNMQILSAIARNNWCKVYSYGKASSNQCILIGSPENVEVVKYIASVVTPIFVRASKVAYQEYLADYGPVIGLDTYQRRFIMGAAEGLNDKLAAEKEKFVAENDCTALVRTNEVAITDYADKKYGSSSKGRKTVTNRAAAGAYDNGYKTGKNVSINKGVGTTKPISRGLLK